MIIWGGLLIDSTVVSTAGYRAFVPFVLITPNHELWIKINNIAIIIIMAYPTYRVGSMLLSTGTRVHRVPVPGIAN